MSEPIPESIPTSYDPRTRRPTKKRALSPHSTTAASITTLFAAPEKALLDLPPPSASRSRSGPAAPPEIVQNVQGSSAGAGSGEFHVYKASRRREYERVRGMEEEVEREEGDRRWEREREERRRGDEERTRRRREKRERGRKRGGGRKGDGGDGVGVGGTGRGRDEEGGEVGKVGKVKPRARAADAGEEVLGGDGLADEAGGETRVVEEIGVVIHDDD